MKTDQTPPKGSSLIWVHIVCNIDYQTKVYEEQTVIVINGRKRFN